MKRIVRLTLVLAVLGVTMSMAAPGFAAQKGTARPYSETSTAIVNFTNGSITGSGVATHLGRFTSNTAPDGSSSVYTAANGDTLTVAVQVDDVFVGGDCPATSDFGVHATATITSGTGRFQGAQGVFHETNCATLDLSVPGFRFSESVTGTISY